MVSREYAFRQLMSEFDRMTEDEVIDRFREYGFLDWDGHQLASRMEFLALVKLMKRNNREYVVITA